MVGGGLYTSGFDARHAVVYVHLPFPPAIPSDERKGFRGGLFTKIPEVLAQKKAK